MATLSLLDAFGLDVSGSLKSGSHFGKVLSQFQTLQSVPVDQVPFASGKAELTFLEPISLSLSGLALVIGTGVNGNIRILSVRDHKVDTGNSLDPVDIHENEVYVCIELTFSVKTGVTIGPSTCAFGLAASKGFKVAVQKRFFRSDSGMFPGLGSAMAAVLRSFVVPESSEDLIALDRDTMITTSGTGQFKLSNSFGIAAPVKQLAATSPIAGQVIHIDTAANFTAEFSLMLEGGYASHIRKLESGAVAIGISQPQSSTLAVQVSASAGLAASVGKFDLAEKFIAAISRNPVVDLEEFRRALPDEDEAGRDAQISAFQDNLGSAISTKISASVVAALSNTRSTNPVFVFEINPDSLQTASTAAALVSAMNGDFTPLTRTPLPPGTKQTANIFTTSEVSKQKLTVNVLGLVNYVSIGKLARVSEIKRNPDGEITCVSDTADANRMQALLLNVAGSPKRLQSLLSEDFLIQATFKVVDLKVLPPDFSAKHTFLEINKKTDSHRMKELLEVCRTMGMLTLAEESARLNGRNDFGRTTFWLQTTYPETSIERTFLNSNGKARSEQEFVLLGRQALGQLIDGDEGQDFRKVVADLGPKGDSVWKAMEGNGNRATFNGIFGLPLDVVDPRVEAAGADYSCIKSWASAMHALADVIVETRSLIASAVNADDDRLSDLRQQLRDRMADVVKHSGEHFGEPLGLVTVFLASGQSGGARVIVNGASVDPLKKTIQPRTLATSVRA